MISCEFNSLKLVTGTCGLSKFQKQSNETIALLKCSKDVKGHLKRLNTSSTEVKDEATLILARAGMLRF